ncbi:MMPL family protein, partial [Mycobacterium parascrofulaceum ATCC BAA-614]
MEGDLVMTRIALLALAAPRRVLAVAALIAAAAALFGVPVAKNLSAGGFQDPTSESAHANELLGEKFGQGDQQLQVTVTSADGATGEAARAVGTDLVNRLHTSPHVADISSAWTSPPAAASRLVSRDGKTGLIVASITGGENNAQKYARTLAEQLGPGRDGVSVRFGGVPMVYAEANQQSERDLLLMESIAVPLSFVVLTWVFGGLLAAAVPMLVGAMAIVGSMSVLRLITFGADVSIFALNLTTAMGLALAIDYTLLIISRYRDELAEGSAPRQALIRTMVTAGRTVVFSATTVALSMATAILFPMYFLKSFAYAGVATVAFAALAAVVVTPAAIVVLGARLDALDVRRLGRRLLHRGDSAPKPVEELFWYRSTKFVMRHALPAGLAVIALLVVLGAPFLGVKWGLPDERMLPHSSSAYQVGDQLRAGFTDNAATAVTVVIPDADGLTPAELDRYAADLSRVPDVLGVSAPGTTFAGGRDA